VDVILSRLEENEKSFDISGEQEEKCDTSGSDESQVIEEVIRGNRISANYLQSHS